MAAAQNFVTVTRRPPDVEDYIDMLRRYRSWLIGPMFGGLVVAVVVAFLWPDTYVSQAILRITPQQISASLVPTVVNMQMQQRLQQMQQEILSRGSLTGVDPAPLARSLPQGAPAISHGRHYPGYAQQGHPDSTHRSCRRRRPYRIGFHHLLLLPRPVQGPGGGPRTGHQVHRAERHRCSNNRRNITTRSWPTK